jgi:hypothetical protein
MAGAQRHDSNTLDPKKSAVDNEIGVRVKTMLATTSTMHRTTPTVLIALAVLAVVAPVCAQELDPVTRSREGFRLRAGTGIETGFLDFRSDSVVLQANLGEVPTTLVGIEGWLTENAGFDASYQFGFLGELSVPLDTQEGASKLAFVTHRLEGAFHYRWFFGSESTSMSVGLRVGFLLHALIPSPHKPTIIVSTTYAGPMIGGTLNYPFQDWVGVEAGVDGVYPYNVREFPDVSGTPQSPLGYGASVTPWVKVLDGIYLKAKLDYRVFTVSYEGRGNRGLGNVTNGSSFDGFQSAQLIVDWIP